MSKNIIVKDSPGGYTELRYGNDEVTVVRSGFVVSTTASYIPYVYGGSNFPGVIQPPSYIAEGERCPYCNVREFGANFRGVKICAGCGAPR